jgi:selenocysteine-specific elongation factor
VTVVVGTAGHIDHGKTTLLRALTGIDADRLPEERRRGMTIDVGYAHLALDDGSEIDFVDVPGHDRLVGNMLVGAGEIDAVLLVVAADDGPRAQTIEHLELLDALGIGHGLVAVTKADLVPSDRLAEVVEATGALVGRTALAGAPVVAVSAERGDGLADVRAGLVALRDTVSSATPRGGRPARLAIDRAFAVRGRGAVVTGTLRGESMIRDTALRMVPGPGDASIRIREIQVHGRAVERAAVGRAALAVAGVSLDRLTRGQVLAAGPDVVETSRMLAVLRPAARLRTAAARPALPRDGARAMLHVGTDHVTVRVIRAGRESVVFDDGAATAILRLDRPIAVAIGDRFVLRDPGAGSTVAGGVAIDPLPARGIARRRATAARLATLAAAADTRAEPVLAPLVDLHGAVPVGRSAEATAGRAPDAGALVAGPLLLAPDVAAGLAEAASDLLAADADDDVLEPGVPVAAVRGVLAAAVRRVAPVDRRVADAAAVAFLEALVRAGRIARSGERVHLPGAAPSPAPRALAALDRLVTILDTAAPPSLAAAVRAAGCPPEAVRTLEAAGEIVRVDDDLAFAAAAYRRLEAVALDLAERGPLVPAAYRDAIGSSRKYVMALLEEFGRRGLLVRTAEGHVPGPRRPVSPGR